jgi:hypothetical protein
MPSLKRRDEKICYGIEKQNQRRDNPKTFTTQKGRKIPSKLGTGYVEKKCLNWEKNYETDNVRYLSLLYMDYSHY